MIRDDLARMAALTFQRDALATQSLKEMSFAAEQFYKLTTDSARFLKSILVQLDQAKESKLASPKCRWFGVCPNQSLHVERSIQELQFALPILDELANRTRKVIKWFLDHIVCI